MAHDIMESYIKGPDSIDQARTMILVACVVVVFTMVATSAMYGYSLLSPIEGELGRLLDDPTIPIVLVLLAVFGYFTYKEKVWAAIMLLVNQLLDIVVIVVDASGGFGILTIAKVIVYVGAIRAAWYLRNQRQLQKQNA